MLTVKVLRDDMFVPATFPFTASVKINSSQSHVVRHTFLKTKNQNIFTKEYKKVEDIKAMMHYFNVTGLSIHVLIHHKRM